MSKPTPPSPRRPRRPDNPAAPVPVNLGDPAVEAFMRGGRPVGTGEGANDTVAPAVTHDRQACRLPTSPGRGVLR